MIHCGSCDHFALIFTIIGLIERSSCPSLHSDRDLSGGGEDELCRPWRGRKGRRECTGSNRTGETDPGPGACVPLPLCNQYFTFSISVFTALAFAFVRLNQKPRLMIWVFTSLVIFAVIWNQFKIGQYHRTGCDFGQKWLTTHTASHTGSFSAPSAFSIPEALWMSQKNQKDGVFFRKKKRPRHESGFLF